MLNVWMGMDPREVDAYRVAHYSLQKRASVPVLCRPLGLPETAGIMDRPIECRDGKLWCPISNAPMSTEFAVARFAVPLLQREGWALFCDCDVLFRADVAELFALANEKYAVMCVKHAPQDGAAIKMDGQAQTYYARKNWSSVVLWQTDHPSHRRLTPELLNGAPGRDLHAFCWLADEEIGELPRAWNHLVGVSAPNPAAKIVHFTLGTPNLPGYENGEYAQDWLAEWRAMNGIE